MTSAKSNIVLIGMPGAGKSTLGVVLAKIMNKGFVDTDLLIQAKCGRTLQDVIDSDGSDAFIAIENGVLCGVEAENSVIATGGSAVYSEEAMRHLHEIGTIVYLEITFESLLDRLIDLDERGVVLRGTESGDDDARPAAAASHLGNATGESVHDEGDAGADAGAGTSSLLRALYDERVPLYRRYADVVVTIDDLSITAAARKVNAAVATLARH